MDSPRRAGADDMTDSIAAKSIYPLAPRPVSVTAPDNAATAALGLICVLSYLLLNPFLATFLLAIVNVYRRIPAAVFLVSASVCFTLFFFFRDYGVLWYFNSSDDVVNYVSLYHDLLDATLPELVDKFITAPNGNELLWELPWWGLANIFEASESTFIFLHYLLIFVAVFLALYTLSSRHFLAMVVVYLFLMPISIDSISHIWRQQLAFSMYLAGVGLSQVRGYKAGRWLIYLSPFVHLSLIFFVAGYLGFRFIRWGGGFKSKFKFTIVLALVMTVVPFLSSIAVRFLDAIGLERIMSFFEAFGSDVTRVYMILGLYMVPLLAAFYLLKNDDTNDLFMFLCIAVFSIVAAIPAANGIYDRLLMFVLPLLGIFFFRTLLRNFSHRWEAPFLLFAFVTGLIRLYLPTRDSSGPMYFLALGHAFDPLMGILKMLVVL
jgi:hypothetical protein